MEHNPGEENKGSASEEIPRTLRTPKAYYRIRKSPLPVSILIQINVVLAAIPPF